MPVGGGQALIRRGEGQLPLTLLDIHARIGKHRPDFTIGGFINDTAYMIEVEVRENDMGYVLGRESQHSEISSQPFPALGRIDGLFTFVQTIADAGIDQDEFFARNDEWAGETHFHAIPRISGFFFFPQLFGDDAELCAAVIPPEAVIKKLNFYVTSLQHDCDYS